MTTSWLASYRTAMKLLALAILVLLIARVEAVVLCAKPRADGTYSTTIKIREACTGKEMALTPAALGLQGPPGPPGPTGPTGATGPTGGSGGGAITVVDSNDVPVGQTQDSSTVIIESPLGPILLTIAASGFVDSGLLAFGNADCSGPAFVPQAVSPPVISLPPVRSGVAYLQSGPPVLAHIMSYGGPGMCQAFNVDIEFHQTLAFDLNALGYVPPFRVVTSTE